MVTLPIELVLEQYGPMGLSLAVFALTSLILEFTWYDKLGRDEKYVA